MNVPSYDLLREGENILGSSFLSLGGPCGCLGGPCWGQLGTNLAQLGPTWANIRRLGANLGPTWNQLGVLLGPIWANLGQPGPTWGQLRPAWANMSQREPTWGQLKANMDEKIIEKPLFFLGFFNTLRKSLEASGNALGDPLVTPWGALGDA